MPRQNELSPKKSENHLKNTGEGNRPETRSGACEIDRNLLAKRLERLNRTLKMLRKCNKALVRVEDTGIGIEKKDIDKASVPFMQGGGSSTRTFGGTGLGLAISEKIVIQMNGKIWVESEGGGKGTTVMFTLPLWGDKNA